MRNLTTARLRLRAWDESDRDHFCALARDERVVRFIGDGRVWPEDRIEEIFRRQLRHWDEHGFGWYSALAGDDWIGFVGLNHVGPEATEVAGDEVEIGWWLHPAHWRRGFATEGAVAARDDAFGRLGLERIIGRYRPENTASGAIMQKLGMTFEEDAVGRHGEVVRIYALTREGWSRLVAATTRR